MTTKFIYTVLSLIIINYSQASTCPNFNLQMFHEENICFEKFTNSVGITDIYTITTKINELPKITHYQHDIINHEGYFPNNYIKNNDIVNKLSNPKGNTIEHVHDDTSSNEQIKIDENNNDHVLNDNFKCGNIENNLSFKETIKNFNISLYDMLDFNIYYMKLTIITLLQFVKSLLLSSTQTILKKLFDLMKHLITCLLTYVNISFQYIAIKLITISIIIYNSCCDYLYNIYEQAIANI